MNVAGRFGYAATWLDLTRPALRRLGQPGAPFEALTGALSLLGQVGGWGLPNWFASFVCAHGGLANQPQ